MTRLSALALSALLLLTVVTKAADPLDVKIGYLRRPQHRETISLLRMPARDDGIAGAEMAVKDNDTTGRFLNQRFSLIDLHLTDGTDVAAAVGRLADQGVSLVVTDLPAEALLTAADAGKARGMLFFNAAATADRLRQEDCRAMLGIIVVSQLIRLLSYAVSGEIAVDGVLALLGFSAMNYLPVLLSISLFISILLTLSRSYRDSEMVVWFCSGIGLTRWVRPQRCRWKTLVQ